MKLQGRHLWCSLAAAVALFAAVTALADSKVEHRTRTVRAGPDPAVQRSIRYLCGDSTAFNDPSTRRRDGLRRPPWWLDWRRQIESALAMPSTAPRHPLSQVAGRILVLDGRAKGSLGQGKRNPPLAWLTCSDGARRPTEGPRLALNLLRIETLGTHHVGVGISCRTTNERRQTRLLLTVNGRGDVETLAGLTLIRDASAASGNGRRKRAGAIASWPLRPARLRSNFSWMQQLPGRSWLVELEWTHTGSTRKAAGGLSVGVMPFANATRVDETLRATLRFDAKGAAVQVLFAGGVPSLPAERAAAGQRRNEESGLTLSGAAAETLVPVPGVGLWQVFEKERPQEAALPTLWLQQVAAIGQAAAGAQTLTDAAYAAWRLQGTGGLVRVAVPLPRTAGEGLWSCLRTGNDLSILDCRFDAGNLPASKGFSARQLQFTRGGELRVGGQAR